MAKIQTKPTSQIDRIRAVHQKYGDLLAKSAELTARREAVLAEIKPLGEEERKHNISWVAQAPKPKPVPRHMHAGALELVGDLISSQSEEELPSRPPRPSWPGEDRLRELGAESESITEALRLLAPELRKARREYSTLVATQRKAEHQAHAEAVVDAAKALGDAVLAHHKFIDEQRRDSVAYQAFRPLRLESFGNLNEPASILMRTITDAVECGHVGAGKIPKWEMPADISCYNGGDF